MGVPRERIVLCPRSENFWQVGPTGPCGPSSELYLDRGLEHGLPEDLPGEENERFLEYWNLVFMQYNQQPPNHLEELPARNIDTGLGLNRLAAIIQEKRSVFETDQFWPLIELGQELSGARYGADVARDRALRILADHSRAMTFLVADGVVPSNEDRGYVLRRVMRRAIHQGRVLEMAPGFLLSYSERVRELMGGVYPELVIQREAIEMWLSSEEESFSRTLEQGLETLRFYIDQAHELESKTIRAEDAFRLHDTSGFPIDLTRELVEEEGLTVDEEGFQLLMEEQRTRARAAQAGTSDGAEDAREHALELLAQAGEATHFTGYETERQATTVEALAAITGDGDGERLLVKLADSPFYAVGGGQVSDSGLIECEHGDCEARVADVVRIGDDQALEVVLERGELTPHQRVLARVDHAARHATEANHTATHLLHAALRALLGPHVRQAGSYVGPDKLRFDFTHTHALSPDERREIADQVNAWIAANDPVHPIVTTREEAERLGAMALFGEKYGDVVRMVEIGEGEYSRELCGGTHVRSTGEIGVFHILSESSSAANVRRIEALTGPAAVALLRAHEGALEEAAAELRVRPEAVPEAVRKAEGERRSLQKAARAQERGIGRRGGPRGARGARNRARRRESRARARKRRGGPRCEGAARRGRPAEGEAARCRDRARRHRRGPRATRRERRAVARGARREGRRDREGRGGGRRRWGRGTRHARPGRGARPRAARGGARERAAGDRGGARRLMRVLALDYGSARCGCALSDPSGRSRRPLETVLRPATRAGLSALAELISERGAERVVVGLPLDVARR